jgi:uncharacterized protein (TIGR00156 family)
MLLGLSLVSVEVAAEYRGPRGGQTTVAEILKRPKDETQVLLRGVIAQRIGPKKYVFRDATGEIPVQIKDKLFPVEPVDDKTQVEIAGEVEKDFRQPVEIDVDMLRILTAPSN